MEDTTPDIPHEWAKEDEEIARLTNYLSRLGLKDLASEIHDLKYVNRDLAARLAADYWSMNIELWKMKEDRLIQDAITIQSGLFDKSSSYNTVIMSLGYAGFFAIWSSINLNISTTQNAIIGFLLGSSLLIFIIWTMIVSAAITIMIRRRAVTLNKEYDSRQDLIDAHMEVDKNTDKISNRLQRYWPFAFIFSVITGLSAGIYLLALLTEQMIGFRWMEL